MGVAMSSKQRKVIVVLLLVSMCGLPSRAQSGSVLLSPTGDQTVTQRDGTALSVNSLIGTFYANAFPGATVADQINAAVTACPSGGQSCTVVIPATMGPGNIPHPLPQNVVVMDYRLTGVGLYSSTTNNQQGGCGFSIYINSVIPANNPPAKDCVGQYTEVNSDSSHTDIWGGNVVTGVLSGLVVNATGYELDVNNDGIDISNPFSATKGKTIGLNIVSGGHKPLTAQVLATSAGNSGAWHHGYVFDALIDDAISFFPAIVDVVTTQAITGSGTAQTIGVNDALLMQPGKLLLVDATSANTEDVTIIKSDQVAKTVTGIFTKNHTSGVNMSSYTAERGIDFSGTMFHKSTINLGSLAQVANVNSLHYPSMSITDSTGVERITDSYNTGTNLRHIHTIGGGLQFTNAAGLNIANIDETTGNMRFRGSVNAPRVNTNAISMAGSKGQSFTVTLPGCTIVFTGGIATSHSGTSCP
jgi:hypothetical protein